MSRGLGLLLLVGVGARLLSPTLASPPLARQRAPSGAAAPPPPPLPPAPAPRRGRRWAGLLRPLVLIVTLGLVAAAAVPLYAALFSGGRPPAAGGQGPAGTLESPLPIDVVRFTVRAESVTFTLTFPEPATVVAPFVLRHDPAVAEPLRGVRSLGEDGRFSGPQSWRVSRLAADRLQLVYLGDTRVSDLSLTLAGSTPSDVGERRYLRSYEWSATAPHLPGTRPVTPTGPDEMPDTGISGGALEVRASGYLVEKVEASGRLDEPRFVGPWTFYRLGPQVGRDAAGDSFTVPRTSVDLVDLRELRDKDRRSLILGALLGVAGGLLVEILLALSGLSSRRSPG